MTYSAIAAAAILTSVTAQAAVIAEYNFSGNLDSSATPVTGVTANAVTEGAGIGGSGGYSTAQNLYTEGTITGADLDGEVTGLRYHSFTIDVASGFQMDLTSLTLDAGYSMSATDFGGKIMTQSLLTSVGGFSGAAVVGSISSDLTAYPGSSATMVYKPWVIDLNDAAFQGLTGSTEFRFYMTDNSSKPGRHRMDDFVLNGEISAVPEPSCAALLGLGGFSLIMRRRR